ncbi:rhomboid family intramembrane serine protease [Salinisphaera sp. USBA-960]|nr:rhomboid family intramembrane serine protease [Salifodinibacter halophilus]NNC25654.1 rhomboid family intramembrane serine protease [Salifodinibacter halophilus]
MLWFEPGAVRRGEYYRLITHGFVHGDGQHLLFNMITLFFFGRAIEGFVGHFITGIGFALFYLAAIAASIVPSFINHRDDPNYRCIGASGAVSAILFGYILLAPWSTIYVFVVPVPAIVFAALYTAYGLYAQRLGETHINHSAHLWGGAFGIVFILALMPQAGTAFIHKLLQPIAGL